MTRNLKSVPRLTLVFIITLIISGSILTYFSINNISNFKELTQKKISEEQEQVVERISEVFQEKFDTLCQGFNYLDFDWSVDSVEAVKGCFILDENGGFLRPFSPGQYQDRLNYTQSRDYIRFIELAQNAEFQEQNLSKARRHYEASLKEANNDVDSANSLNTLARVSRDLGRVDKAYSFYSQIIKKHFSTLNKAGFPYSYFAILQALELDIENKSSIVYQDLLSFLTRMENGKVPLSGMSTEVLNSTEEWINSAGVDNQDKKQLLQKEVLRIRKQLKFISDYQEHINTLIVSEKLLGNQPDRVEYRTFPGMESDLSDLLVIETGRDSLSGFVMDLKSFWGKIRIDNIYFDTEFEYQIELIDPGVSEVDNESELITEMQFSPHFPSHQLRVRLKDENIVNEYVSRRSWIYGIALILLLGGMLLGVSLILRDIRRENRMVGMRSDFVSNVTHELKTPLTSINMFAESIYLGGGLSEEDQKQYSNVIIKESGNLRRMINNILSFSIKEGGKQNYQFRKADLSEIVESTLEEMSYWLEKHGFNLKTEVEENIWLNADQEAIKQALSNLINNAIKYSPESKNLFVRLYKSDGKAVIEIEDTGIGIPENQINRIFEKFYRVRSKDTESTSGTGIGLTVCKDIIEAHGGNISVESELNKGSTFKIILNI